MSKGCKVSSPPRTGRKSHTSHWLNKNPPLHINKNYKQMAGFELDMLGESLHKGRPKDEEPHVKRAVSKKGKEAGIEYILRSDLVRFSIDSRSM